MGPLVLSLLQLLIRRKGSSILHPLSFPPSLPPSLPQSHLRCILHGGPLVLILLQLLVRRKGSTIDIPPSSSSSSSSPFFVVPAKVEVAVEALPEFAAWREGGRKG